MYRTRHHGLRFNKLQRYVNFFAVELGSDADAVHSTNNLTILNVLRCAAVRGRAFPSHLLKRRLSNRFCLTDSCRIPAAARWTRRRRILLSTIACEPRVAACVAFRSRCACYNLQKTHRLSGTNSHAPAILQKLGRWMTIIL
jgi:hypothetical protein